jgi:hypothetical protein
MRTRPEGLEHELDYEEASDKPCRVIVIERVSLRDGIDYLVISWLGMGVARVLCMHRLSTR